MVLCPLQMQLILWRKCSGVPLYGAKLCEFHLVSHSSFDTVLAQCGKSSTYKELSFKMNPLPLTVDNDTNTRQMQDCMGWSLRILHKEWRETKQHSAHCFSASFISNVESCQLTQYNLGFLKCWCHYLLAAVAALFQNSVCWLFTIWTSLIKVLVSF